MTTDHQILAFIRSNAGGEIFCSQLLPGASKDVVEFYGALRALLWLIMLPTYSITGMGKDEAAVLLDLTERGWSRSQDPAAYGCPEEFISRILAKAEIEKPWAEDAFEFLKRKAGR